MATKEKPDSLSFDPLAWVEESDNHIDDIPVKQQKKKQAGNEEVVDIQNTVATSDSIVNETESVVTEDEKTVESKTNVVQEEEVENEVGDSESSDKIVVVLEETNNIQNVGQLYDKLLPLLKTYNSIDLDASKVSIVDTSTLQLLAVAKQEAVKLGKTVNIDFPSDKFVDSARLLGLDNLLNVDQPESGFF